MPAALARVRVRHTCLDCDTPIFPTAIRCPKCAAADRATRGVQFPPSTRHPLPLDEIRSVLNPVQSRDLEWILERTPYTVRVPVALAFANLFQSTWAEAAGFDDRAVNRWVNGQHRIPIGAAFRLAKVLDVNCEVLFRGLL